MHLIEEEDAGGRRPCRGEKVRHCAFRPSDNLTHSPEEQKRNDAQSRASTPGFVLEG